MFSCDNPLSNYLKSTAHWRPQLSRSAGTSRLPTRSHLSNIMPNTCRNGRANSLQTHPPFDSPSSDSSTRPALN